MADRQSSGYGDDDYGETPQGAYPPRNPRQGSFSGSESPMVDTPSDRPSPYGQSSSQPSPYGAPPPGGAGGGIHSRGASGSVQPSPLGTSRSSGPPSSTQRRGVTFGDDAGAAAGASPGQRSQPYHSAEFPRPGSGPKQVPLYHSAEFPVGGTPGSAAAGAAASQGNWNDNQSEGGGGGGGGENESGAYSRQSSQLSRQYSRQQSQMSRGESEGGRSGRRGGDGYSDYADDYDQEEDERYSRAGTFKRTGTFQRTKTMLSRTLTRTNTMSKNLGRTMTRTLTKQYKFDTEEEVEAAAAAMEEARRKRLEAGDGKLEDATTKVVEKTAKLARTMTMAAVKPVQKALENEKVQKQLNRAMTFAVGRPDWSPEPSKVPIPATCNCCSLIIIFLILLIPGLLYLDFSRQKTADFFVKTCGVGQPADHFYPVLELPTLPPVCSSGGYIKNNVTQGVRMMPSTWFSNGLPDGAQIQLQATKNSLWWSAFGSANLKPIAPPTAPISDQIPTITPSPTSNTPVDIPQAPATPVDTTPANPTPASPVNESPPAPEIPPTPSPDIPPSPTAPQSPTPTSPDIPPSPTSPDIPPSPTTPESPSPGQPASPLPPSTPTTPTTESPPAPLTPEQPPASPLPPGTPASPSPDLPPGAPAESPPPASPLSPGTPLPPGSPAAPGPLPPPTPESPPASPDSPPPSPDSPPPASPPAPAPSPPPVASPPPPTPPPPTPPPPARPPGYPSALPYDNIQLGANWSVSPIGTFRATVFEGEDVNGDPIEGTFLDGTFFRTLLFRVETFNPTKRTFTAYDFVLKRRFASSLSNRTALFSWLFEFSRLYNQSRLVNFWSASTHDFYVHNATLSDGSFTNGTVFAAYFIQDTVFPKELLHASSISSSPEVGGNLPEAPAAPGTVGGGDFGGGRRRLLQTPPPAAPPPPKTSNQSSQSQFDKWSNGPVGLYSNVVPTLQEHLTVVRINKTHIYLKAPNDKFLVVSGTQVLATSSSKTDEGIFKVTLIGDRQVVFQTYNGGFVGWGSSSGVAGLKVESSKEAFMTNYGGQGGMAATDYYTWNVREVMEVPRIRGMNLGAWLLLENWMTPSLYEGVPDYIDGWKLQFKSVTSGNYLSVNIGSNQQVTCRIPSPGDGETFALRREYTPNGPGATYIRLWKAGNYVSAINGGGGPVYATSAILGDQKFEAMTMEVSPDDSTVMFKTANGFYLTCDGSGNVLATATSGDFNGATAFKVNRMEAVQGEYQISAYATNSKSSLKKFRDRFIQESDFQYLAKRGINTVRIPVGYWIAQGTQPDDPWVAGSDERLDWAFKMAEKYNIRVVISMHAAPGAQNHGSESAARDGVIDWARYPENIQVTLNSLDWIAGRYSKSPALLGIGVINEPNVDGVSYETLRTYQVKAYNIIRKYSPCAFVIITHRIGSPPSELDGFMTNALEFNNVMVDVHHYNVFDPKINTNSDFNAHIEFIKKDRAKEVREISQGDRLAVIGEFSLALPSKVGAGESGYRTFGRVQLSVYNNATGGWFFWSYKVDPGSTGYPNWSLQAAWPRNWLQYG